MRWMGGCSCAESYAAYQHKQANKMRLKINQPTCRPLDRTGMIQTIKRMDADGEWLEFVGKFRES